MHEANFMPRFAFCAAETARRNVRTSASGTCSEIRNQTRLSDGILSPAPSAEDARPHGICIIHTHSPADPGPRYRRVQHCNLIILAATAIKRSAEAARPRVPITEAESG
jgi:hypothetical protein